MFVTAVCLFLLKYYYYCCYYYYYYYYYSHVCLLLDDDTYVVCGPMRSKIVCSEGGITGKFNNILRECLRLHYVYFPSFILVQLLMRKLR